MAEVRKIVKAFLASPGDLGDERSAARSVVDEINFELAKLTGYQVELVGWEDTLPNNGRPQEIINRDLEGCELFVGMLWKRWGTVPDAAGPYSSGFEEEFSRSLERHRNHGQPQITLLLKDIEPEALADPGPHLKKVLDFKKKVFAERKLLAGTFSDLADFRIKFRRCVSGYITNLKRTEVSTIALKEQSSVTESNPSSQTKSEPKSKPESPLSAKGAAFLRDFVNKADAVAEAALLEAHDVARLRLLGSIVGVAGNDVQTLHAHDANLLFKARGIFNFGWRELVGLLDAGLDQLNSENAPLWHWVGTVNGFKSDILQVSTLSGPASRRINALSAMRVLEMPLEERDTFTRAEMNRPGIRGGHLV